VALKRSPAELDGGVSCQSTSASQAAGEYAETGDSYVTNRRHLGLNRAAPVDGIRLLFEARENCKMVSMSA
jgi:hypothetical protein